MPRQDREKNLSAKEQRFFDYLAKHYTPTPLTAARRAAFDRSLEARISHPTRPFLRPGAVLATAVATMLLYFALPYQDKPAPVREVQVAGLSVPGNQFSSLEQEAALFGYPYPNSAFYTDWGEKEEEDFLPHDYIALAWALEL